MAQLLITGGAGFIGSHTSLVLLEAGHQLLILDNFSNSSPKALVRICELIGSEARDRLKFLQGDIRDKNCLEHAFSEAIEPIDAVIHFAGLKSVSESIQNPLRYWDVNVTGSRCLLEVMNNHDCYTLVFSSSATLYGYQEVIPIPESANISPINPYGSTKAAVERMLGDIQSSKSDYWRIACLRYFNPVGAHPSGRIGENPYGIPNNLFPLVCQVALGSMPKLKVFGGDWPTCDGTGVRDYIHVMDLAEGHRVALDYLIEQEPQFLTLNIGSGRGHSVMELVRKMESVTGRLIPLEIGARRPGDAAISVADATLALKRLGWCTKRGLEDICRDGWAWQIQNPQGYDF